jgi:hypothetical protein
MGIYCHVLNSNQLVQVRGYLWSFIQVNVQADLKVLAQFEVILSIEPI